MTTAERVNEILATADLYRTRRYTVAEQMCMCDSALGYKLKKEGTRYYILAEAERKRRAIKLLSEQPKAMGTDLVKACGYQSDSHIYDAFFKWFGVSLADVKSGRATLELIGGRHAA